MSFKFNDDHLDINKDSKLYNIFISIENICLIRALLINDLPRFVVWLTNDYKVIMRIFAWSNK